MDRETDRFEFTGIYRGDCTLNYYRGESVKAGQGSYYLLKSRELCYHVKE